MDTRTLNINSNTSHTIIFSILRISIGWHFLWEGWIKLSHPTWSAAGYLNNAWGPLAPLFKGIAEVPFLLAISDFLLPWLLFLSGLMLMLGLFTRMAIGIAMLLLVMFICATPAVDPSFTPQNIHWEQFTFSTQHAQWAGKQMIGAEGNYFLVSKNLIEFFALACLLTIPQTTMVGLDSLMHRWQGLKRIFSVQRPLANSN